MVFSPAAFILLLPTLSIGLISAHEANHVTALARHQVDAVYTSKWQGNCNQVHHFRLEKWLYQTNGEAASGGMTITLTMFSEQLSAPDHAFALLGAVSPSTLPGPCSAFRPSSGREKQAGECASFENPRRDQAHTINPETTAKSRASSPFSRTAPAFAAMLDRTLLLSKVCRRLPFVNV